MQHKNPPINTYTQTHTYTDRSNEYKDIIYIFAALLRHFAFKNYSSFLNSSIIKIIEILITIINLKCTHDVELFQIHKYSYSCQRLFIIMTRSKRNFMKIHERKDKKVCKKPKYRSSSKMQESSRKCFSIGEMSMVEVISADSFKPASLSSPITGDILTLLDILYAPVFTLYNPSLPLLNDSNAKLDEVIKVKISNIGISIDRILISIDFDLGKIFQKPNEIAYNFKLSIRFKLKDNDSREIRKKVKRVIMYARILPEHQNYEIQLCSILLRLSIFVLKKIIVEFLRMLEIKDRDKSLEISYLTVK
uniref:Uncharacterized protein n=1 Tax=Onchocerca volvulus TaxID=6282 RepID=A0A8R1TSZ4_ONCVO